jgi:Ca-activated chloride channel family protein
VRRVGEIIDEIDLHGKNQELVNELVSLATRHGILTPYTSFLADENANIRDVASTQLQTGAALDALQRESGDFAFRQRQVKGNLQTASQAGSGYAIDMGFYGAGGYPGASAGGLASGGARRGAIFGGMPGGAGAAPATTPSAMPGMGMSRTEALAESPAVATTVINVGKKTFFQRKDRWEDSVLTEEQLQNVKRIERYSDEYFALSKQYGKEVAKYLALEGKVVILLGNQAYEF